MIAGDIVWVGTPDDVIERIEAVRDVCEGLTEISITVNPGGFDHWQAIKNQELFAHKVMPHFKHRRPAKTEAEPALTQSSAPSQSRSCPLTSIAGICRLPASRGAGFHTPHERR